ncbi:MAG: chorismate synthase [Eubacteriales bacterium]
MSSNFGDNIKVTIFGQSHSDAIGVVIDGLPAGETIDLETLQRFMNRRAPGSSEYVTQRQEKDIPEILSGLLDGVTCGAPLCAIIKNNDAHSKDYDKIRDIPRPSHADYPAYIKYEGFNDIRGGGHFSGRMTAPLCFAGAVCKQILERRGIFVGAHISAIGDVEDELFGPARTSAVQLKAVGDKAFPTINDAAAEKMVKAIEDVAKKQDSIGGVVECCAVGMPTGIGEPMFDGVENRLASAMFGIPAVKGIEFGIGFAAAKMHGSENNDPYFFEDGKVKTLTNNHGGILGGITTGMPIILRVAFKPTPSIGIEQNSVKLSEKTNSTIKIEGRHDPCIVPRAVVAVEAVTAIVLLDLLNKGVN